MAVPFMRAYTELLVQTCHRRGAHAIGGMAAFIPSRRDAEVNERRPRPACARTRSARPATASTAPGWPTPTSCRWPGRSSTASSATGRTRRTAARGRRRHPRRPARLPDRGRAQVTEDGVRIEHRVALQYLDSWLQGQRRRRHPQPDGGRGHRRDLPRPALAVDPPRRRAGRRPPGHPRALPRAARSRSSQALGGPDHGRLRQAAEILDALVLSRDFVPFLTVEAYRHLD